MKRFLGVLVLALAISLLAMPMAVSAAPVAGNPVALHVEVAADTISISVTPADLQFGKVAPGGTSPAKTVTITNNSTKAVNLTVTATPEFWAQNLRIDDLAVATWGVTPVISLAIGGTRDASLTVVIPADTTPGVFDGSVTFWAE